MIPLRAVKARAGEIFQPRQLRLIRMMQDAGRRDENVGLIRAAVGER